MARIAIDIKDFYMKLSVIICVYNTRQDYLDKCLATLTRGTLSLSEYEICVVDDGSVLDYTDIVKKYNVKYRKTENRGILNARLLGIELAEGDYIAFCDSDDTVSMNYHLPMLERALESGADIVMNDWAFHTERTRYACLSDSTVSTDISRSGDDVLLAFFEKEGREHSFYVLWNKIYKRDILQKSRESVESSTGGFDRYSYSEDALLNFYAFKYAKKLENIHTGYYFYRIHDSQTVNVVSRERLVSHIECMSHTLGVMSDGVSDNAYCERLREHIKMWQGMMSRTHYSYAKAAGYTDLYELIKEKYGVESLSLSTVKDGSAYSEKKIIGANIEKIDESLADLMRSNEVRTVDLSKTDSYARRTLEYLKDHGARVEFSLDADTVIEREEISLKQRIIHNRFLYTVGLLLFPKGSRIRAFLKRRI